MSGKFKGSLLLSVGVLLVAGSFIMMRYQQLPDLIRGSMMGMGLALEVLGLAMMQREKRACVRSRGSDLNPTSIS